MVDAPVSGSTHPAELGQLTVLASGPESARTTAEPIFDALASRVLWVGDAGMGSSAKMPVLDVVLERFATATPDLADQDLAAIYELGGHAV